MHSNHRRYSIFTAIAMIVGICIGSGIFFKADNVLIAVDGSIIHGAILFILGAIAIIFGGLSIGELASRTDEPGGVITYSEKFVSVNYAAAFGWFHSLVYYPTLIAVVSYAVGVYVSTFLGLEANRMTCTLIGIGFIIICYVYNTLLPKFGGYFQNVSCVIKLLPLVILIAFGLIWAKPNLDNATATLTSDGSWTWLMGLSAVTFSYDGWIVSTSIAHEIKNSKKNLP